MSRVMVTLVIGMVGALSFGQVAAPAQEEAKKPAVPNVVEELRQLRVHEQSYERGKEELDAVNLRLKGDLAPLEKAKTEAEFFKVLTEKALPALKMWRQDLRARKGQFLENDAELRGAISSTIKSFEARRERYEKAAPTLRTAAAKKQVTEIAQRLGGTAKAFREYLEKLEKNGDDLTELFDYCEDADVVLEALDAYARGELDVATKKLTRAGNIEELRAFLKGVRHSIDRALERRPPKLPAVPGLDGVPPAVPPAPPAPAPAGRVHDASDQLAGVDGNSDRAISSDATRLSGRVVRVLANNSHGRLVLIRGIGEGQDVTVRSRDGKEVTVRTSPVAGNLSMAWAPPAVAPGDVAVPTSRKAEGEVFVAANR